MTPTLTGDLIPGQRIELIAMPNDPCPIPSGERGTVLGVQTIGWVNPEQRPGPHPTRCYQIQVRWDCGRTLELASPPDNFRVLTRAYPKQPWRHFDLDPAREMYIGVEPKVWLMVRGEGNEQALITALGSHDLSLPPVASAFTGIYKWQWGPFDEGEGRWGVRPLTGRPRQRGMDLEFIRRIAPFCIEPFAVTLYDYEQPPMWRAEWDPEARTLKLLAGEVAWRHIASITST
jgi:hypothetical protein